MTTRMLLASCFVLGVSGCETNTPQDSGPQPDSGPGVAAVIDAEAEACYFCVDPGAPPSLCGLTTLATTFSAASSTGIEPLAYAWSVPANCGAASGLSCTLSPADGESTTLTIAATEPMPDATTPVTLEVHDSTGGSDAAVFELVINWVSQDQALCE